MKRTAETQAAHRGDPARPPGDGHDHARSCARRSASARPRRRSRPPRRTASPSTRTSPTAAAAPQGRASRSACSPTTRRTPAHHASPSTGRPARTPIAWHATPTTRDARHRRRARTAASRSSATTPTRRRWPPAAPAARPSSSTRSPPTAARIAQVELAFVVQAEPQRPWPTASPSRCATTCLRPRGQPQRHGSLLPHAHDHTSPASAPRLAGQDGFSMLAVLLVMIAASGFIAAGYAAAQGDLPVSRDSPGPQGRLRGRRVRRELLPVPPRRGQRLLVEVRRPDADLAADPRQPALERDGRRPAPVAQRPGLDRAVHDRAGAGRHGDAVHRRRRRVDDRPVRRARCGSA